MKSLEYFKHEIRNGLWNQLGNNEWYDIRYQMLGQLRNKVWEIIVNSVWYHIWD